MLLCLGAHAQARYTVVCLCVCVSVCVCVCRMCISLYLPPPQVLCGWGCEALLSGDLEGDHTDQKSAAGRAEHPQSGELGDWNTSVDKLAKSSSTNLLVEISIIIAIAKLRYHNYNYAWSGATKCFILLEEESRLQFERGHCLFKSSIY